jgi:hypothetical protein
MGFVLQNNSDGNRPECLIRQEERIRRRRRGKSDVYRMKCPVFPLKYLEQKERTSKTRYRENTQALRSNNSNYGYSNHILHTGHTYRTIIDIIEVIKTEKKCSYLNCLEKCPIYKISQNNLHTNDTYTDMYNIIFETLYEFCTRWQHTPTSLSLKRGISHTKHS